jgi:uncharacterized Fe-S cluster-containing radical SAM superfamily protein
MIVQPSLFLGCTLDCEYCFLFKKERPIWKDKFVLRTPDEWWEALRWMESKFRKIDLIDLVGGETFLYPHIMEFIEKVPDDMAIGISTNCTVIPEEFYELPERVKRKMALTLSAHMMPSGEFNPKFEKATRRLTESGFKFQINLVGYDKVAKGHSKPYMYHYEKVKELCKELNQKPILTHCITLAEDGRTQYIAYSDEAREYYRKNMPKQFFEDTELMMRKGESPVECYVSNTFAVVDSSGNIHRCWGSYTRPEKSIGNIFKKEMYVDDPLGPFVCEFNCVHHPNFTPIRRWKLCKKTDTNTE